MLFVGAKIYKLECVDISVQKVGVGSRKDDSVSGEGSCAVDLYGDEYLAEAYRTEVSNPSLSSEWGSFIQCEGQKFMGGATEFREKLTKYAVEVGFNFVYIRNDPNRVHAVCYNADQECDWEVSGYLEVNI